MNKISGLRLFLECIREARQTKKDIKTLENIELSIEALQRIVNTVAFGSQPVEVEITLASGGKMLIKRQENQIDGYETFAQRVEKARKNR